MMESKELRIGNFVAGGVLHTGIGYDYYEISYLTEQCAFFKQSSVGEYYKDLKPIPLTEDWLKRLGFVLPENNAWWQWEFNLPEWGCKWVVSYCKGITFLKQIAEQGDTIYSAHKILKVYEERKLDVELEKVKFVMKESLTQIPMPVRFVHEMQNVIFALTGSELTPAAGKSK